MPNHLSVAVSPEKIALADKVRSPFAAAYGVVAVLDALGAKNYGREQVAIFLESRTVVLEAVEKLADQQLKRFNSLRLKRSAFQDSVIICYVLDDLTP